MTGPTSPTPNAPGPDELEISVFGPGVGECILLHVGEGQWIVVDSCLDEASAPIALSYLASIGVDPEIAIRLVAVTHWHDDHIAGISDTFRRAKQASLVCSAALGGHEFQKLTRTAKARLPSAVGSGVDEFVGLFHTLVERLPPGERKVTATPTWAFPGRVVYTSPSGPSLTAMSPSDVAIKLALLAAADERERLQKATIARRIVAPTANDSAVVLWLSAGGHNVLLGSDLEVRSSLADGWNAILSQHTPTKGTAAAFKVAHHGSAGADEPRVWTSMLDADPACVVTPYRPSHLPTEKDIERLKARGGRLYQSADSQGKRPEKRNSVVERTIREVATERQVRRGRVGHIRLRAPLAGGSLEATLFHGAREV